MAFLMNCGICCAIISVWGIVQLIIMGILFQVEAVVLLEEGEDHEAHPHNVPDFIASTKNGYSKVARNCYVAAVIYVITLGLSLLCYRKASKDAKAELERLESDECKPKPEPTKETPKKKRKFF